MATHSSVLAWRIPGMGGCLWCRRESDTTEVTEQQQHIIPLSQGPFEIASFIIPILQVKKLRLGKVMWLPEVTVRAQLFPLYVTERLYD